MKKVLLPVVLACLLASPAYALKIVIVRTMINGDGSGHYRDVSRESSIGGNAAGEQVNVIIIGCSEPGDHTCPKSLPVPVKDGDPAYMFNQAIMNFIEVRMGEIDREITLGNDSEEATSIVYILLTDGTTKAFRLYQVWSSKGKDIEISLTLEDLKDDEIHR